MDGGAPDRAVRRRAWLPAVAGLALLAATVLVGVRVFAPADTLTPARQPYPARAEQSEPRAYADLPAAPLILDRRLRVFAAQRHLWADSHVRARKPATPYWSLWRWPAQIRAVVALPGPVVVSQWSDDTVLALDARLGTRLWRAHTRTGGGYTGRRTGATTVYTPDSLLVSTADTGPVVLSVGPGRATALDGRTGRTLWSAGLPAGAGCEVPYWTAPGLFVTCDGGTLASRDARTGRLLAEWPVAADPQPLGCAVGHSDCRGLRAGGRAELLGPDAGRTPAPALAPAGAWLAGDLAVAVTPAGRLTAADPRLGVPVWSRPAEPGARIVAVTADRVHLVTPDRRLLTVRLADGWPDPPVRLVPTGHRQAWRVGHVYAVDGFVTVERVRGDPSAGDGPYYYGLAPVEVIGS